MRKTFTEFDRTLLYLQNHCIVMYEAGLAVAASPLPIDLQVEKRRVILVT